jgi:hypothetical protein
MVIEEKDVILSEARDLLVVEKQIPRLAQDDDLLNEVN